MNPWISVGFYVVIKILTLLFCLWIFRRAGVLAGHKALRRSVLTAGVAAYILLGALPVGGTLLPNGSFKFMCQGAGNIWLGFLLYFYGILISGTFVWLVFVLVSRLLGRPLKFLSGLTPLVILSVCGSLILLVYGMQHAQKTVVTTYDVNIDKPAGDLDDLKLILIGDLHLSVNSHLQMIRNMVDEINRQDADLVVVAGDVFTSSYGGLKHPEQYAAVLSEIKSRYGTYAVYGNHDVEEDLFGGFPISPISEAFRSRQMEQFFEDCRFTILYDETVPIADGAVLLTGRVDGEKAGDGTDVRKSPAEVLAGLDTKKPVIVLEHEPVEFAQLFENGADLTLCGHTHAGQVFPGNLIVPFFNENAYGYKVVSGLQTIVTSGIGYYGPPMRVGTDSEIAVVNIHFS